MSPGRVSPKGSAVAPPPHSSFLIRDILNDPGHSPGAAQALFANSIMQQQLAALGNMGGLHGPGGLQGIPGSLLPRPPMFMPPRPVSPADSFDRGSDHDDRDDGEFKKSFVLRVESGFEIWLQTRLGNKSRSTKRPPKRPVGPSVHWRQGSSKRFLISFWGVWDILADESSSYPKDRRNPRNTWVPPSSDMFARDSKGCGKYDSVPEGVRGSPRRWRMSHAVKETQSKKTEIKNLNLRLSVSRKIICSQSSQYSHQWASRAAGRVSERTNEPTNERARRQTSGYHHPHQVCRSWQADA